MTYSETINQAIHNTYRSTLMADAFLRIKTDELKASKAALPVDLYQIADVLADYTAEYSSHNRGEIFALWQRTLKILDPTKIDLEHTERERINTIVYAFHKHGVDDTKLFLQKISANADPKTGTLKNKSPYNKILTLYSLTEPDLSNNMVDITVRLIDITEALTRIDPSEIG